MSSERDYNLHTAGLCWQTVKATEIGTVWVDEDPPTSFFISATIPSSPGYITQVGLLSLQGMTGPGGSEVLTLNDGTDNIWKDAFVITSFYTKSFDVPLSGQPGTPLTARAECASITAGLFYVVYRQIPD